MAEQVDQVAADTVIEAIKHARHGPPELGRLLDEQVDPAQLTRDMEPLMAAPALLYSVTTTAAHDSGTAVGLDLRTQDGRWWHLDASVTTSAPPRFTALRVHARPPAFNGRPGGLIVCVFGPSSSGKSALMEALADQAGTPWTRFDEMFPGQIPIRYLIWPGAAGPMRPGFLAGVAAFARAGNQVALSAAPDPDVRAAFDGIATVFVHLTARLEILLARQAARRDRWGRPCRGDSRCRPGAEPMGPGDRHVSGLGRGCGSAADLLPRGDGPPRLGRTRPRRRAPRVTGV